MGGESRVVVRREGEGRRRFRDGEGGCGWEDVGGRWGRGRSSG